MIIKTVNINTYEITLETDTDRTRFFELMCPVTMMKAAEVLEYLGISRATLSQYVKKGIIKTEKVGGQYRYDAESVYALKK